jgi:predicted outer membrane repeat protein
VSGNDAIYGGGISTTYLTLTNSTVSGNYALYGGGGIFGADLTLTNGTVSGNYASLGSGGISGDSLTVANTIVTDNGITAPNCNSAVNSLGYNLTDDNSCGFTEPTDLVVADAMLGPLKDNGGPTETHGLLAGSPAIDAGSVNCPPPATDQRGEARPFDGDDDETATCDIGSVEYLPEPRGSVTLIAGAALLALLYRRRR